MTESNWGCGGCHQNGMNPKFNQGLCTVCDRSKIEIEKLHGFVIATEKQLIDIQEEIRPK